MPPSELSTRTRQCIERLFAESDRTAAAAALRDHCGMNGLPGLTGWTDGQAEQALERIRLAALKVSDGDVSKLWEAIELARLDWRDLLVIAGFGDDSTVHLDWNP